MTRELAHDLKITEQMKGLDVESKKILRHKEVLAVILKDTVSEYEGYSYEEIKDFITGEIGYDLSRTCDEIRPDYYHVESCQQTVPEAITAFLEGKDFEDVIRTAVSLGGDCDTLTCIAGSIAEAFYGVPDALRKECKNRLPADMLAVLKDFHQRFTA